MGIDINTGGTQCHRVTYVLEQRDFMVSYEGNASKHATQCVDMSELAISTRNKIQLARYQLARESEPLVVLYSYTYKVPPQNALGAF